MPEFDSDGCEAAVRRAVEAGVGLMVFPNVDVETAGRMQELHRMQPEHTLMAMGLHPTELGEDVKGRLAAVREMLYGGGYVAVGEVGIDLYWDTSRREEQMDVFTEQLRWARELGLPVIIHCREGLAETLECIERAEASGMTLVFHSFTGTAADAERILRDVPGAMFGINGVVTFKSARELREVLPHIGIDRILLETDSPYLAPVPHRGKRNESAYLPAVCAKVAEVLGMTPEEVERVTDANARRVFLPHEKE